MSYLSKLLPFPILIIIVSLPIIFGNILVIRYNKELRTTGILGVTFTLILLPMLGLLLAAIKKFDILKGSGNFIFLLSLFFLFAGIILLCIKAYNNKIKFNPTYRKIFWR